MGSCISNIQKSLYYQNYTDVQLNIKSLKKKKKKKAMKSQYFSM